MPNQDGVVAAWLCAVAGLSLIQIKKYQSGDIVLQPVDLFKLANTCEYEFSLHLLRLAGSAKVAQYKSGDLFSKYLGVEV